MKNNTQFFLEHGVYLDNNATTPVCPEALDELVRVSRIFGNPSSIHRFGKEAKIELTKSREKVASFFGIKEQELLFTSSATESLNLVIRGLALLAPKCHIVTSSTEHAAVFETVKHLEKMGHEVTFIRPDTNGVITKEQVESAIKPHTKLLALASVNSETGVMNEIEAIAKLASTHRISLVVDAVGQFGKAPIFITEGVSALAVSGHKMHAPKGVSACFIRKGLKLFPQVTGGHQEFERRAGTENVAAIAAFAKALEPLSDHLSDYIAHMTSLREYFEKELFSSLTDLQVNGSMHRVCNTSNIAFLGVEGELLLQRLDLEHIAASHGAACSSGALEPSRVLLQMGLGKERASSSLRFSLSRYTTKEEIDYALDVIVRVVKKLRSLRS